MRCVAPVGKDVPASTRRQPGLVRPRRPLLKRQTFWAEPVFRPAESADPVALLHRSGEATREAVGAGARVPVHGWTVGRAKRGGGGG